MRQSLVIQFLFQNILFGIGGGMLACFGQVTLKRQELLLYATVSILTVNTVNAVLNEWDFYMSDTHQLLVDHPHFSLISYGTLNHRFYLLICIHILNK